MFSLRYTYGLALLAVLACLSFDLAEAHAGHFHMWPSTPVGQNYIRTVVKKCTQWRLLPPASQTMISPPFKHALLGPVELQSYLYKNCSSKRSIGMEFNITVKAAQCGGRIGCPRQGVANLTVMLQVMSAKDGKGSTCRRLEDFYMINPEGNKTDNSNYVWVQEATTDANGNLLGGGANAGAWRADEADAIVIFHNMAGGDHSGHGAAAAGADDGSGGALDNYDYAAMKSHALACCQLGELVDPDWATKLDGQGNSTC